MDTLSSLGLKEEGFRYKFCFLLRCNKYSVCSFFLLLCFCSCFHGVFAASPTNFTNLDSIKGIRKGVSEDILTQSEDPALPIYKRVEFRLSKALAFKFAKGDKQKALKELFSAEQLYKSSIEPGTKPSKENIVELGFIAASFEVLGEVSKSKQLYLELEGIYKSYLDESKKSPVLSYPGVLFQIAQSAPLVLDSFAVPKSLLKECLRQVELQKQNGLSAIALTYLGMLQVESGQYDNALEPLKRARELFSKKSISSQSISGGLLPGEVNFDAFTVDVYLAKTLLAQRKFSELEVLCKNRIHADRKMDFPDPNISSIMASLATVYLQTGRKEEALKSFQVWNSELKANSKIHTQFLRHFAKLESYAKVKFLPDGEDISNQATVSYEAMEANKTLVNALISHYYVLKELGLFQQAAVCFELETRLRKLSEEKALARELTGPPVPEKNSAGNESFTEQQKQKLERANYEVQRAFSAYRKALDSCEDKARLNELDLIIAKFEKECS